MPVVSEIPSEEQAKAIPAAVAIPAETVMPIAKPKAKIGKDLLASLKEKNKATEGNKEDIAIPLTPTLVAQIKEEYLEKLASLGRDLLKNQFMLTTCNARDEATFECVCSMHLQYNSINNLKQDLADFIAHKVNNPKVKILTILVEKEEPVGDMVLSKVELFDSYAALFPLLKTLKDELQMSVKGAYAYVPPVVTTPTVVEAPSVTLDDDIDPIDDIDDMDDILSADD